MVSSDCTTKTCSKCGQEFPATTEYFYQHKNRKGKKVLTGQCRTCIKRKSSNYREANPIKAKESKRRAVQNHRDRHNARGRKWAENNPEKKRAIERRYRDSHPERCRESNKRWLDRNPHKRREYTGLRRKRKTSAAGRYTAFDIQVMYRAQKGLCWWCGKQLNGNYEIDHRIPVSRGGTNYPNNLCLCCRACNRSKSDKLPGEWNGRLL